MTKSRMSIFDGEDDPAFDVSAFTPKTRPTPPAAPQEVRALAEAMNFRSREARPASATEAPATETATGPRRQPRRHRTGRTAQLNVRTRPETFDAVYAIADEEGWLVGETVERALEALQRERAARSRG